MDGPMAQDAETTRTIDALLSKSPCKMCKDYCIRSNFHAIQACFSVAIMSPSYQELVYGYPKKVQVDILDGDAGIRANETVKLYGGKMEWRGELFLTCGTSDISHYILLFFPPSFRSFGKWSPFRREGP